MSGTRRPARSGYARLAAIATCAVLVLAAGMGLTQAGCSTSEGDSSSRLMLASTTSTYDSRLFDELLPAFEAAHPRYDVVVNAVGTGEALKLGESCDADMLLVHAPDAEREFVAAGYGIERREIMYNDFVIVGPGADPAGIAEAGSAAEAFVAIADGGYDFVSRGDDSGTSKAELRIWKSAAMEPAGEWYRSVGQGMGATLRIAFETGSDGAYTLADRGTFLSMRDSLPGTQILLEGDPALYNQYSAVAIDPGHCPEADIEGAQTFIDWLESAEGQQTIAAFGVDRYGRGLFVPNAGA